MLRSQAPKLAMASLLAGLALAPSSRSQDVRFNRDVRPILSDRCFQCHGVDAKARKADLRLDTWEGLTAPRGWRLPAVSPGNPDRSSLVLRVESDDPKKVMPPPSTHKTVTPAERAVLRAWIEQGAPFEEHWAFVPPDAVEPPPDDAGGWARTEIDRFIARRLAASGLDPQPDADRETLIRRVSLDLTGLPPSVEDIQAFLADERPDAYEILVDRVLASPHYGERMAQVWLDAARYADTNGFHHDNVRTGWPYRDWVIEAFRQNMPYDRFVTEQIAGDLLPEPTVEQRIASGFCRMHNINDEGGAIDQEYRVEALADRIETVATAFLGVTMTCARCHDHKYDPFTQEDYYSLFAVFGSIDERGVYSNNFEQARAYPARLMYEPAGLQAELAAARKALASAEEALVAARPAVEQEMRSAEETLRARYGIEWVDAAVESVETRTGTPVARLEDGSIRLEGRPETETFTWHLRTDALGLRMVRFDALADPSFHEGRVGLAPNGNAVVSGFSARAVSRRDPTKVQEIRFVNGFASHEQPNGDYDLRNALVGEGAGWALEGHGPTGGRTALLLADAPFGFEGGTDVEVTVACESRFGKHVPGRTRVALARTLENVAAGLPVTRTAWWLAGGFQEKDFATAWATRHGPDAVLRLDVGQKFGKVGWTQRADAEAGPIRLNGERSAFYLATELHVPTDRPVPISLGSDDAIQVFVDGQQIFANETRRGAAPDQERLTLDLSAGVHTLVVKVINDGGPGGFFGRIDVAEGLPDPLDPIAFIPRAVREPAADDALMRAFGSRSPTWQALDEARTKAQTEVTRIEGERVPVLVMAELAEPVQHHVLTRGQYDAPDMNRPVIRRPPMALGGAFPEGAPSDRLGFAQWLTAPDNPLTARVHVNRLWSMLFGTGLCATQENFGQQAEWPSHPELLDWLARTFIRSGFDQKALLRRIMLSSVYRQRAAASAEALGTDPANRLLSHFPRRRLAAEFVRDVALAAAGILDDRIGGPSVRPYQPDGLWREVSIGGSSNTQVFRAGTGADLYRRSLYTFWKRTSPSPQMSTFDAPTREFCVVDRATTNTPLQALVLWNDVQFVEAARALATRVLREAGTVDARTDLLFRLCTARRPGARERQILTATLGDFLARYREVPDDARALLAQGETPPSEDLDAAELAAWTMLGSTVLSLDETLVRD
ncbi:MAG: hypothetical protein RL562_3462 [Planctomycetota bacterium]